MQEVGFTLSNAIAYVEAALERGLKIDEFAPRLAFFFNCHNNVFQEIAKFRAVRRMWAKIVEERFGAEDPNSMKIRFHTQTGGVTLQAQQPEVNIIRVALQGFAAVCGGTQSLHTNGFDEALALPTERSARIALRTQQVLAHESGVADTVDPFAGSYFVESLTDEIEPRSWELMDKVEELGGSVEALEFMQREIEESAHSYHERYQSGQDIVVGVNKYVTDQVDDVDILRVDPESEQRQLARLKAFKESRDQADGRGQARGPARRRPRRGQPPAPDPRRPRRRRLDRRGLRRDARRLRRIQRRRLLLERSLPLRGSCSGKGPVGGPRRIPAAELKRAPMIEASRTLMKSEPSCPSWSSGRRGRGNDGRKGLRYPGCAPRRPGHRPRKRPTSSHPGPPRPTTKQPFSSA